MRKPQSFLGTIASAKELHHTLSTLDSAFFDNNPITLSQKTRSPKCAADATLTEILPAATLNSPFAAPGATVSAEKLCFKVPRCKLFRQDSVVFFLPVALPLTATAVMSTRPALLLSPFVGSTNMPGFGCDRPSPSVAHLTSQSSNADLEPELIEEDEENFETVIWPEILMIFAIHGSRLVNDKKTGKRSDPSKKRVLRRVLQCSPITRPRRVWRFPRLLANKRPKLGHRRVTPSSLASIKLMWILRCLVTCDNGGRSFAMAANLTKPTATVATPPRARLRRAIDVTATCQLACCQPSQCSWHVRRTLATSVHLQPAADANNSASSSFGEPLTRARACALPAKEADSTPST